MYHFKHNLVINHHHIYIIKVELVTDDKIILLGTQSNLHHLAEAECLEHSKLAHVSSIKSGECNLADYLAAVRHQTGL